MPPIASQTYKPILGKNLGSCALQTIQDQLQSKMQTKKQHHHSANISKQNTQRSKCRFRQGGEGHVGQHLWWESRAFKVMVVPFKPNVICCCTKFLFKFCVVAETKGWEERGVNQCFPRQRRDSGLFLHDQLPNLLGVPAREKKVRSCFGLCFAKRTE